MSALVAAFAVGYLLGFIACAVTYRLATR